MEEDPTLRILLLKATLNERCERYDEMITIIKEIIQYCHDNNFPINTKIRNLFSVAYKNKTSSKRTAWRTLNLEKEKYSNDEYQIVYDILKEVENELNINCDEIIFFIDSYILNTDLDIENKIFFLKMKGDYFRYKAEVAENEKFEECKELSRKSYEEAMEISKDLPAVNSLKLGLCLNYSVFFYEIEKMSEKACSLAKTAFDDAIKDIDILSEEHYKDSTLIMQLLRDNLSLWNHKDEPVKKEETE